MEKAASQGRRWPTVDSRALILHSIPLIFCPSMFQPPSSSTTVLPAILCVCTQAGFEGEKWISRTGSFEVRFTLGLESTL
jgi:hypothetical protein